jgi:hypothetical protein
MSRDYAVVVKTEKGLRFKPKSPKFNVNVWCVEWYGWIFKNLGLPTGMLSHSIPSLAGVPAFKHEYIGPDLEAVRNAVVVAGFRDSLVKAISLANEAMEYKYKEHGYDSVEAIADEMLRDVFPLFLDPEAVAVASDYCEYHE